MMVESPTSFNPAALHITDCVALRFVSSEPSPTNPAAVTVLATLRVPAIA